MASTIDVDKRRAALKEIDDAKFGWYHVRACLVAGTGFFMDAYDLFAINLASTMIYYVYFPEKAGKPPSTRIDVSIKVASSIGTLIGQLGFGYLADRLGRKRMYGVELMIIIAATAASAMGGDSQAIKVYANIIVWRIIMGIGIGGDYPLSAIITSEFATKKRRGAMMASVFAMQGFGILGSALVSVIVLSGYKNMILEDPLNLDYCWRLVLGCGAIPGLFALYFRLTIPETPRYTMDVEQDVNKATTDITSYLNRDGLNRDENGSHYHVSEAPKASWSDFFTYFGKWENGKVLLGTSLSWFILDIAFYGLGLNNSVILGAIGFAASNDPVPNQKIWQSLFNAAVGNIIIAVMGTIPGYWVTVLFVDKWGRKPIQLLGFAALTVLFIVMGVAFDQLKAHNAVFIVLFTLAQFFQNFGPNTTTFIVPGEVFPTRYRSTGHGISAASGKLGAIVAQVGFSNYGADYTSKLLIGLGCCMSFGFFSTFLIPETKGLSLEELSNEDHHYDAKDSEDRIKSEV